MVGTGTAPGLSYVAVPAPSDPSPLRTDVAGFFGPTRRGPAGAAVRVEGWRGYLAQFGGFEKALALPYALYGYFNNGGQVAHVVRTCGPLVATAKASWQVGSVDNTGQWISNSPASNGFSSQIYRVDASSPGAWANDTEVQFQYRRRGLKNLPEVDVTVRVPGEPLEYLTGIHPEDLPSLPSLYIKLTPLGPVPPPLGAPGPNEKRWPPILLRGGDDGFDLSADPDASRHIAEYRLTQLAAIRALNDVGEVALLGAPHLYWDPLLDDARRDELVTTLLTEAADAHDRLVVLDAREPTLPVPELLAEADRLRDLAGDGPQRRAAALYHPWLEMEDPIGSVQEPLIAVPPSGHVLGVISRLDRDRGAHHTPANAPVLAAVDLTDRLEDAEQSLLNPVGVNLLRCMAGHGLQVWGGRTLDRGEQRFVAGDGRFVAHRRLIHRLVRAVRRVAEPLVFDINGPELWLTLVRAATTVLLEAFRAGALLGSTPSEAFFVKCDQSNNPPEEVDNGRCLCEIGVAPARPMEFIRFKVALLGNGALEVIE